MSSVNLSLPIAELELLQAARLSTSGEGEAEVQNYFLMMACLLYSCKQSQQSHGRLMVKLTVAYNGVFLTALGDLGLMT